MNILQALQLHQQICDELHELALEENRFLQQHRRAPEASLLERKRSLLARLDESLNALRTATKEEAGQPSFRQALDKARARVLQVLQLDKENEQLLLRYSLSAGRPAPATEAVPSALLQRIYQRHS